MQTLIIIILNIVGITVFIGFLLAIFIILPLFIFTVIRDLIQDVKR